MGYLGNNYHDLNIIEFRKREIFNKPNQNLPKKFNQDGWKISINTNRNNGFHWVGEATKGSNQFVVRDEKIEEVEKKILNNLSKII